MRRPWRVPVAMAPVPLPKRGGRDQSDRTQPFYAESAPSVSASLTSFAFPALRITAQSTVKPAWPVLTASMQPVASRHRAMHQRLFRAPNPMLRYAKNRTITVHPAQAYQGIFVPFLNRSTLWPKRGITLRFRCDFATAWKFCCIDQQVISRRISLNLSRNNGDRPHEANGWSILKDVHAARALHEQSCARSA